ncbi:MAG: metallophosphoesterase, partial [Clostridia bacterium]|nr:metallophosphoesterase [Clostridia bacterium]
GEHYGLALRYDTNGFTSADNQIVAASYIGITINGDAQTTVLWGGDQLLFWIPKEKFVEGYNGYSHPTFKVMEGATVVNENDETFTLGAATLYFVNGKWTTEKPANYSVTVNIPDLGEPDCVFKGFNFWNNENGATLFEFSEFVNKPTKSASCLSSTGHYITLNGTRLTEIYGANVYTWENTNWLRIDILNPTEGSILFIEEGTPFAGNYLPRLAFQFNDGVWVQAFIVDMEINGETFTVYSKNDVPVVIDDVYFENLLADNAIPGKVVSFSTRGVTYGAGTTFRVLTDTTLVIETIGFDTTEGASVRLNTPTGIRYETKIDKADYDRFIALYGEENVETGTYIVPRSLLATTDFRAYFADTAKVDGTDYVKIVNSGWANKETVATDGYYLYYGSLVNLQPINYGTDFFGIGYIQITDGDNVYIVYGGYDVEEFTRNIYYVSAHAYKDYAVGSTQKNVLKSYLDSVVYITDNVVISTIIDVAGYVSPYSVSYDAQTGVYTVTGNAEIKSVIIGDKKKISTRTSTLEVNGNTYYVTDYNLTASATASTLTFKLSPVLDPLTLVDFAVEVPSNRGVKILQITDTELMDAAQMRTAGSLTAAQQEEYARKNIYANAFNYISALVEQDRPDLIVLTGDIVNGIYDDNGSMWLRLIEFMDSLNIPWAPVFGGLENESAMGAEWQRAQLAKADNCLFKTGTVTGNGDYTIAITDKGVVKRVLFMLNSNGGAGLSETQVSWMKDVSANVALSYGEVPAFVFCNTNGETSFASDFAAANVDGVFMGNAPYDNSTTVLNGISYTYGTKTGSYGEHDVNKLGGTYIDVASDGVEFTVWAECLDKTTMENKESIRLVQTYDGSSVVTDAYLTPIWDTDRIYDETAVFVGETGSVTLMYTPADPEEVVVRDITLGVTYTYGVDYTISGNKVTRIAGGNLPYRTYEEYYRKDPVVVNGNPQNWRVDTVEDNYKYSGTRYMYYAEAYEGASRHVTFTYNKTETWEGTKIVGDNNAQAFINQLKTEKEGSILFYGDSITVGCNASGTEWGGNRNPFLPAWDDLVSNALAEMYGANITKYNCAVGGWTTAQGAEDFTKRTNEVGANLADIDLLVLAFGMNDPATEDSKYIADIKLMIDTYYAANPNGNVILVSPMLPNTQSKMVYGNHHLWENALNTVKNSQGYASKNISLARVFTMFNELVTVAGKLSRDHLGNNINHPTDFGVRLYAQVILKTLCGDDFA